MSRTYRNSKDGGRNQRRQINARAIRRNPPDLRLLSRALLMQAADEAAAAATEVEKQKRHTRRGSGGTTAQDGAKESGR